MTVADRPPLTCTVLGTSQGRDVHIDGQIVSREAMSGTFRLIVRKSGPSGTSNITQGGTFASVPGRTTTAGSATISLEPGARYTATMQVQNNGAFITCKILEGGTF